MMTNDFRPADSADAPFAEGLSARDGDSATMIRSEERLDVHVESVPVERVRLERYIVTEERTITVTVSREEVRLVREPILDGHPSRTAVPTGSGSIGDVDAVAGPASREVDLEMVLAAEEIVVTKKVVPVERVRLVRDRVTELREVTETVRKEQVDLERLDSAIR